MQDRIKGFSKLKDEWSYPGSVAITPKAIEVALILSEVFSDNLPPSPLESGGIAFKSKQVMLDVEPNGVVTMTVFSDDEDTVVGGTVGRPIDDFVPEE